MQSPDDEAVSVTIYLSGLHREVEPVEITLMGSWIAPACSGAYLWIPYTTS